MGDDRAYDIILLGATGFTGRLTARYLAAHAPAGLRWAVAGRSPDRLDAVRDELAALGATDVGRLAVDLGDVASVRQLAAAARTVVTTVGPYALHGEPVVAACAAAGTHYLDITGEPEFVDRTYVRHHATACATGARLVHCCGFDSVPYDLGALATVQALPPDGAIRVRAYVSARGAVSGGTYASAVTALARRREAAAARAARRAREPRPRHRSARAVTGRPGYAAAVGAWVLPMPTVDPQVVVRSARALDAYGTDFTYEQYAAVRRLRSAVALGAGAAGAALLSQAPGMAEGLRRRRSAGAGPEPADRATHWFTVRLLGEGGGRRVVTEVAGGDAGYDETARMLGEAALCTTYDDLPEVVGQTTTAVAMGDALRERLQEAGLRFSTRVLDAERA